MLNSCCVKVPAPWRQRGSLPWRAKLRCPRESTGSRKRPCCILATVCWPNALLQQKDLLHFCIKGWLYKCHHLLHCCSCKIRSSAVKKKTLHCCDRQICCTLAAKGLSALRQS